MKSDPTNDTAPEIDALLVEAYRRMSAAQKLERVRVLTRTVQALAQSDVRRRYPDADSRVHDLLVASRWIGPELMRRAFGEIVPL
jgi:hypothetical protein